MVGNGATDFIYDVSPSFAQTVYNFNLIPTRLYKTFMENDCFFSFNEVLSEANDSVICNATWARINELTGSLNWYDLYRPVYPETLGTTVEERYAYTVVAGEKRKYKRGYT